MQNKPTIVLVLKTSSSFTFSDVELIARHINGKWKGDIRPRIICLWDKASSHYNLGNIELIPLHSDQPGTWARIQMYSPEMEQYRPFLYLDLDTAIINSVESLFEAIKDKSQFVTLEDFWMKGQLATGVAWIPANSEKIAKIWNNYKGVTGKRMDRYIRNVIGQPDAYWQTLFPSIFDFKVRNRQWMTSLNPQVDIVCFHGHPRIPEASQTITWVREYINQQFVMPKTHDRRVTVIIPYKKDRGWLKDAIASVPEGVQLLVSQGEGNWPANFNKVLDQATGDYIRWLHEDDMLTENSIEDSINAIEEQGVDFIHGNAYEIYMNAGRIPGKYIPRITEPTVQDLLVKNVIHSATLLYRREVFEQLGKMDETLNTAEEFEFNLRCLKAGFKIGYCNSFLAWYRRHPMQKVRTVPEQDKKNEREMVKNKYRA